LPLYGGVPGEAIPTSNAAGARRSSWIRLWLGKVPVANEMEYHWDFAGGQAEYKKGFEIDPNDATAH
jgi:hypothetical protein